MPDPSTFQPSLAQSSKPTVSSLRRAAYRLLGFLAFSVLVFVLWAPLELFPGLRVDRFGSIERFRFLGAAIFAALLFLRFLIRPPKQPSLTSIAWGEFARATGGALSERMMRPGSTKWTGGTSVRWDS